MKRIKIPKLKPEEKEEIIKDYFKKKESEKNISESITHIINIMVWAFLAVCNIITAGLFFIVAIKLQNSFVGLLGVSAICTSVLMSYNYIKYTIEKKKRK